MTVQIIACTLAVIAAGVAVWGAVDGRRTVLRLRAERRTFPVRGLGGEVTVTAPMSEAEYEEIRARWQKLHGNNHTAHHVTELRPADEQRMEREIDGRIAITDAACGEEPQP